MSLSSEDKLCIRIFFFFGASCSFSVDENSISTCLCQASLKFTIISNGILEMSD